jgi:hypothetical protein
MRGVLLLPLIALAALPAAGQNEVDALRFSFTQTPGTARSLGMGGAFSALGADLSSFWLNPGGVGVYRRSGMEVSLGVSDMNAESVYEGESARDGRANLTVQSIGLNSTRTLNKSRWKGYTVGFAYGKHNNFHENIRVAGDAFNTTMLDVFASQANGTEGSLLMDVYPFGAGLAWESYAIDPLSEDELTYVPAASGGKVRQEKRMDREGAMTETAFAVGANYDDWLFLGASVSFHGISFTEESHYTERFEDSDNLVSFRFSDELRVTGSAAGLKIGAMASATPWLRLGAAWHSGVRYGLTDSYSAEMSTQFLDGGTEGFSSPVNVSNYNLRTPGKLVAGAAFILGDAGVVSADYEFSDLRNVRMSGAQASSYSFEAENDVIKTLYRPLHKVRAGAEMRLGSIWRVRTGAQYVRSPFSSGFTGNTPQLSWSAGGGFRRDAFFADMALTYLQRTEDYYLYNPALADVTEITFSRVSVLLSAGLRF